MAIETLQDNSIKRHPSAAPGPSRLSASRSFPPYALVLLFILIGCTTQITDYHFVSRSPHFLPAEIEVHASAQQVVFEVFSAPGICKAAVRNFSESWPPEVIIRLHLDNLEGFTATIGDSTFHRQELDISHVRSRQESYFDIYLPTEPLSEIEEVMFSWIEYYR